MEEFYPGSKMKVKTVFGEQEIESDVDINDDAYIGGIFDVDFKGTGFYTVGTLAKALQREPVTIRKWENEGIIPKPTFHKTSYDARGRRRLYTKPQILGLRRIAFEENILTPNGNGRYKPIGSTSFKARALQLFTELDRT